MPADGSLSEPPLVVGFDRTESDAIDVDRWVNLAKTTLIGESVPTGQLDLIFVDAAEMAELNVTHMGHDGPTDVLSFPLDADADVADFELDFGSLPGETFEDADVSPAAPSGPHLGDVIICHEVAVRQAPQHCGEVDAELSLLVIHGVLHILGHDHGEPAETEVMHSRERHYLAQLGYGHPESS